MERVPASDRKRVAIGGARRLWPLLVCLASLCLAGGAFLMPGALGAARTDQSADEVHPTRWWVDVTGESSTLDGELLPVGAVVRAYDPDGVLAGRVEVTLSGWYLVSVYGDDPETTLDEGAEAGDTITFTVQGQVAATLGPDEPVWTSSGDRLDVELAAEGALTGDLDGDCDVDIDDVGLVTAAWRCRTGEGCYETRCDLDGNGCIDVVDVMQVVAHWDETCSP